MVQNIDKVPLVSCPVLVIHVSTFPLIRCWLRLLLFDNAVFRCVLYSEYMPSEPLLHIIPLILSVSF